jgi:hypothetical protein
VNGDHASNRSELGMAKYEHLPEEVAKVKEAEGALNTDMSTNKLLFCFD